jgi:hypothetical protein
LKRVTKAKEVPSGPHYCILVYKTTEHYVEGDERSRTHPGHGYPAHTVNFDTFEHWVTEDPQEWAKKAQALELERAHKTFTFVCLEVSRKAQVQIKLEVELK